VRGVVGIAERAAHRAVRSFVAGVLPGGWFLAIAVAHPSEVVAQEAVSPVRSLPGTAPGAADVEAAPLTLSEAVRRALASHPSLSAARAAEDRAAAAVVEARSARWPSVVADASATRFTEPMVVAPLHGFDPLHPPVFDRTLVQGSVALGYTVFDGGARGARVGRAESLEAAAVAGAAEARQGVIAEVVRAYLRVWSARELLEAHDRRVAAVERERDRAAQLLDRGRAARVQVLRAEAALSAARADGLAAAAELEVAERELARVMGVDPGAVSGVPIAGIGATGSEPRPDRAALLDRVRAGSPELARLRRQVAAADALRDEARALWFPRVELAGRYVEYASGLGWQQGEWQAGLHVSYPVFTAGARRAALDRAAAEAGQARSDAALAERRIEGAVDRALAALESARARVAALRAAVAQSEEVVRIEKLALDTGAGVQTDYLNAEAELFRARAALTEARSAEVAALVELALLAGELTAEWVKRNLESDR
jgi:outer membrane protein TolC